MCMYLTANLTYILFVNFCMKLLICLKVRGQGGTGDMQLKQGRLHTLNGCFHGYKVNILTLFGSSQHSDISFKIISDTVKLNSYKI